MNAVQKVATIPGLVLLAALALARANVGAAEPVATLEVFDDPQFSKRTGLMHGGTKTLYVRLQLLEHNPDDGYTGLEFSFTGLHEFDSVVASYTNAPSVVLGEIVAPEDTLSGTGGQNVVWSNCQADEFLMTIELSSASPPPQNVVVRVARRFPPTNPSFAFPYQTYCACPVFCQGELTGKPYVLNPDVSLIATSWAALKALYDN